MGIVETSLCVYVCVVVEGMYTCKTGHFGNDTLCLFLCCCRGYVHMQDWGLFSMILYVYVCDIVEGMYTFKTGHFGN